MLKFIDLFWAKIYMAIAAVQFLSQIQVSFSQHHLLERERAWDWGWLPYWRSPSCVGHTLGSLLLYWLPAQLQTSGQVCSSQPLSARTSWALLSSTGSRHTNGEHTWRQNTHTYKMYQKLQIRSKYIVSKRRQILNLETSLELKLNPKG